MKKYLQTSLVAGVSLVAMFTTAVRAEGETVTNVNNIAVSVAVVRGGSHAMPEMVKVSRAATTSWERIGTPFQIQRIDVVDAIPTNGTVIVSRVNGGVTNTLATVTCTNGVGYSDLVDSSGVPNALLIYPLAGNTAAAGDRVVISGTATNAVVELKGMSFYRPGLLTYP
jgi:hypothetical protein